MVSKTETIRSAILEIVTCKACRIQMKELKGHIYHKKRKWKCPKCNRVKMQSTISAPSDRSTRGYI